MSDSDVAYELMLIEELAYVSVPGGTLVQTVARCVAKGAHSPSLFPSR